VSRPSAPAAGAPTDPAPLTERWPGARERHGNQTFYVRSHRPAAAGAAEAPLRPVVVMLHGLGGSGRNWTDLAALLATGAEVDAPDLPGFGQSPPPADGDFSPAAQARRITALIEDRATGGRRVHLMGNSLGGQVALHIAAARPDLLTTLTLLAPAMPETWPQLATIPLALTALPGFGEAATAQYLRVPAAVRAQRSLTVSLARPQSAHPGLLADAHLEAAEADGRPAAVTAMAGSARALVRSLLARGAADPWRLAADVRIPTLLVYGRRDPLVNAASVARAARAFPNARAVVMTDAAHVMQMEHPQRIARLWQALCADAEAAGQDAGGPATRRRLRAVPASAA